ncbi:MAG TPA: LanC-like protein [Gaiellaceae bacterium]|nr:LanC-like protein [Gaiellaceae bacterium]HWJ44129.1 LanC-like protein [Gaiellaceae bacterium]
MLFTPERHEPLAGHEFSEEAAREAIARIVERAESDLVDGLWPLDDEDRISEDEGPGNGLYYGAAGIAWALGELGRPVERELVERLGADDPTVAGSVWGGIPGVLAVAERFWPDASRRDRIAEYAWASLDSSTLEVMFGHPGHMLLAAQLHERTGEPRWAKFWSAGADLLLERWQHDDELDVWAWTQRLGGHEVRYVGAAHGLVGNVHALRKGPSARENVEERAVATLSRLAFVKEGHANWPPSVGGPLVANDRIRVQWCHGAPGILISMWDAAPADAAWSELLLAAGRLVWDAGPLSDAPGICHGTSGSAYALLALWRRTGNDLWLERARALAAHAAAQVEARAARRGHARHSLFTGDEGVALCLASCIPDDKRFPVLDRLI